MYLLDANIFITAKNLHYGFDIVPGFWEWIDQGCKSAVLCSVEAVRVELEATADELAEWIRLRPELFRAPDSTVTASLEQLSRWAVSAGFTPDAISTFLGCADYQLVAYAHAHRHTVVTHERSQPLAKKRILIPDACKAMGVDCMDPYSMLRNESAKFVLS